MKKVLCIALLVITFSSCEKKFEEGQGDRLTSANKRMDGYWELQKLLINGVDSVAYYNQIFKEKCTFKISIGSRKFETGAISIYWGQDSNQIRIGRYWYGNAKSGGTDLSTYHDTLPYYYLFPFTRYWCDYNYDIRYLSKDKLILQIKPSDNYMQRLEFKKL